MFKSKYGDPTPWALGGDPLTAPRFAHYNDTEYKTYWQPRTECDNIPVNGILAQYRENREGVQNLEGVPFDPVEYLNEWVNQLNDSSEIDEVWSVTYTLAEINHARAVLTKLRNIL